ncbi:MAG: alpha/beta fold hydrolase [Marinobacter sp.]|nr:alpha/beta fold hydrolase [Marinobacter sp.]
MNCADAKPPIVLIAGWGVPAAMLEPLVADWPGAVHQVSLDEDWVGESPDVDSLAARLVQQFAEPALWLGWSLGGQVAMAAAAMAPEQALGVLTICSFPRFVASKDWPCGMAEPQFRRFGEDLQRNARRCRQRFLTLQIMGDPNEGEAKRALKPWLADAPQFSDGVLSRTYDWLATNDQRKLWQSLCVPALHLWGEGDRVVRAEMSELPLSAAARTERVPGLTHWPRSDALARCRQSMASFAEQCREVA